MIKNTEVIDKDNNSILKVNSITTETLEESNIFTLEGNYFFFLEN